jgi:5S rRNA maturation endonuclease (ribonuclease M5)
MNYHEIGRLANRLRIIPLQDLLPLTGAVPDKADKAKWHTARGVISVTGMKFINWSDGSSGGGAIDLVMHIEKLGFKAAVFWLRRHFPDPGLPPSRASPQRQTPKLPPRDETKLPRVIRYLVTTRCLPRHLVQGLIKAGTLYADHRGNAVFLLLGKGRLPVGAELRGTYSIPWRGMAPGSCKARGYFSIARPRAKTTILCESAIDAISCFALQPRCRCISTSGATPHPPWLDSLLRQGHQIYCGFDADPTGDRMAQTMAQHYPTIKRLRPTRHDWNDVLKLTQSPLCQPPTLPPHPLSRA